jgi:NTP pyrophosphatase (non-canonical NTP hydrolase)
MQAAKVGDAKPWHNDDSPTITATLRDAGWWGSVLAGTIHGDTRGRFRDGKEVTTSTVLRELPGDVFVTRNSVYKVESWNEYGKLNRPAGIPAAVGGAPKSNQPKIDVREYVADLANKPASVGAHFQARTTTMSYEQGREILSRRFNRTRLTHEVSVDPDALHAVLYGKPANDNPDHAAGVNALVAHLHGKSVANGWWVDPATGADLLDGPHAKYVVATKLMLIVSEIAEAMEGDRKDLMDDKLPHRKMAEVELADAVIRIFDLAGKRGYDLGGAIMEKTGFNDNRADHKMDARKAAGGKAY